MFRSVLHSNIRRGEKEEEILIKFMHLFTFRLPAMVVECVFVCVYGYVSAFSHLSVAVAFVLLLFSPFHFNILLNYNNYTNNHELPYHLIEP